jgi:hypothetical protein
LVSIRHGIPLSILDNVIGDTFAFLESSALLIIIASLISLTEFFLIRMLFPLQILVIQNLPLTAWLSGFEDL